MYSSHPYPSSMSASHFKMMAKSSLAFTPNLPTNTNTYYTLYSSCHPIHTCVPNVLFFFSVAFQSKLRLRRICSTNETFTLRTSELIDYLYKRGYNRYFLRREIQRVNNITRTEALMPHDTSTLDKTERVPFVTTYNTALRSISSIIRKHVHFHILISSPRCYNLFKAAPIVSYRRSSNLSDFVVRGKLRNPTQHNQPWGSYPCGKKLSYLQIHI